MKKIMLTAAILSVLGLVGCGVDDSQPLTEEEQVEQSQEAVTSYSGFCEVIHLNQWKLSGRCNAKDPSGASCHLQSPNAACAPQTLARNVTGYTPCGTVDTSRPCTVVQ